MSIEKVNGKVSYVFTVTGLSALQYVDLRSSRNLYIVGVSIFFPLVLCQWMQEHPGAINTGIQELDGIAKGGWTFVHEIQLDLQNYLQEHCRYCWEQQFWSEDVWAVFSTT